MPTSAFSDFPQRGPGLRKQATDEQWDVLSKAAIAVIHCEPDACDECTSHENDNMSLPDAEKLLPAHPSCRCWYTWAWRPGVSASLSVTSLRRVSERARSLHNNSTMTDIVTKSVYADSVVGKTPNGKEDGEYLKVPISSTGQDRDGDRFSEDGLRDLRDQIKDRNKPLFGNHGVAQGSGLFSPRYQWQDIIGGQEDAEIEENDDEEVLHSYVRPNPENEDGERLLAYAKAGMPVGFSIGFRVLEKESNEETDENVFHSTDLLETSAVGIQSNRESVHTDAAAAEVMAKGIAAGVPDTDFDEETFARAFVSELSAAGYINDGEQRGAGGFSETEPTERRDITMGESPTDDTDEEYLTRSDAEEMFEKFLGDPDDEPAEPEEEESKEAETSDLEAKVDDLSDDIDNLKEAFEDAEPEKSETTAAAEPDDKGGGGDVEEKETEPESDAAETTGWD